MDTTEKNENLTCGNCSGHHCANCPLSAAKSFGGSENKISVEIGKGMSADAAPLSRNTLSGFVDMETGCTLNKQQSRNVISNESNSTSSEEQMYSFFSSRWSGKNVDCSFGSEAATSPSPTREAELNPGKIEDGGFSILIGKLKVDYEDVSITGISNVNMLTSTLVGLSGLLPGVTESDFAKRVAADHKNHSKKTMATQNDVATNTPNKSIRGTSVTLLALANDIACSNDTKKSCCTLM